MRKAFTLIELLVVISIIALLASIVLASLNAAREKGRLGAGKYFASQIDHVAGDSAVGIWDFDECSGSSTADRSGNGNTGTLLGATSWSSNTPSGQGCSMSFTGATGTYVNVPDSATVSLTSPFTLSAWIRTNSNSSQQGVLEKYDTSNKGYTLRIINTGKMFSSSADDVVLGGAHLTGNTTITTGTWTHVASVYDGSTFKMFINGALDASMATTITPTDGTQSLKIGARGDDGTNAFNGLIDSARIYAKALTASEVREMYAKEAADFGLASLY